MKAVHLSIFRHLFSSVAEEMGVTLHRTASSPNIKERLDFSCALFLKDGRLLAQAAHIPVHLGAMPASVLAAVECCSPFQQGDVVIVNDPYLGGSHLPDITLISPFFAGPKNVSPDFFVASRAHHADIGGMSPGSMPVSNEIFQEGLIIPPLKIIEGGQRNDSIWQLILSNVRTPEEREGDLSAQLAANAIGLSRLSELIGRFGLEECYAQSQELIEYTSRMSRAAIRMIPDGRYQFQDYLDDDGQNSSPVNINLAVLVSNDSLTFDFTGTSTAVPGNLNAVPAIVRSAAAYCVRCIALLLLESDIPMNHGLFEPLAFIIEPGSILDPPKPHAVAAGNVETSQRVVDVIFGALASALPQFIPAASQGTMNNLTFGSGNPGADSDARSESLDSASRLSNIGGKQFAYYETIGGGIGAGPNSDGGHGMHSHMSNTRNTPIEALEYAYPIQVMEYRIREKSGGSGKYTGGDGLVRTIQFKSPAKVSLVSERRKFKPYGLAGGEPGTIGQNILLHEGKSIPLPGKVVLDVEPGDQLVIMTPGGGGWGIKESDQD